MPVTSQANRSFFQRFIRTETLGGIILLVVALAALGWANSPWAASYTALWEIPLSLGVGEHSLALTLRQWINDGLMAMFFLLVGLEIKREFVAGELASPQNAALPIAAAVGGMIVPAAIYWSFNRSAPTVHGWGIPVATDIAFALAALAIVAPQAPLGLKIFLSALAVVDDMGAVLVIALFYSGDMAWSAFAAAGTMIVILAALNFTGVTKLWPYLLGGVLLWFFVHESGVHATIAGVALAMTIPSRTRLNAAEYSGQARGLLDQFDQTETGDLLVLTSKGQQESVFALDRATESVTAPILRLEHALHGFSAFVVMPLFAFANAGVQIGGPRVHTAVAVGIVAGLLVGKPLGIAVACFVAVKAGIARLPQEVSWGSLLGAGCLAGIGFTMSLFIAMLAFDSPELLNTAKVAILCASLLAGIAGAVVLRSTSRRR